MSHKYPWKSNKEILAEINKKVSGHEEAKKAIINAVNRSYLRYYQKIVMGLPEEECVKNKNVLLIGDSGTGKTAMVNHLQEIMAFPVHMCAATSFTVTSGANGVTADDFKKDIERTINMITRHSSERFYSQEGTAAQLIVFVDEVDKLAAHYGGGSSGGKWQKQVQGNFLKIFENGEDLQNVTFIFAGAFSGLSELTTKEAKKSLGFVTAEEAVEDEHELESKLVEYGFIPEFLGRINNIVKLDKLVHKDYKHILDTIILPDKQREMAIYGIKEEILSEDQKEDFIKKTIKSGQGVRYLIKLVDKVCYEQEFEVSNNGYHQDQTSE